MYKIKFEDNEARSFERRYSAIAYITAAMGGMLNVPHKFQISLLNDVPNDSTESTDKGTDSELD